VNARIDGDRRDGRRAMVALALALALGVSPARAAGAPADSLTSPASMLAQARASLAEAERWGAKKLLPATHEAAAAAVADAAARGDAEPGAALAARAAAARLARTARFIQDLRRQKNPWQAVAEAYDRDLTAAARAAGVAPAGDLGGTELARAVVDSLGRRRLRCLSLADSLEAERRYEREGLLLELAERDSTLADLRRRVSDLRQSLWEMELRAGVAESDRAAVEARLRRQRERAEIVRRLADEFSKAGGAVSLTAEGDVVLRLGSFVFAPGRTELTAEMDEPLGRLAAAVALFPGAAVRVEGHTDDSGRRAENLRLSHARAQAVAAALRDRLGLPASAVTAVGIGPDRPFAPNATPAGRAKNRRIEVVILAPGGGAP